MRIFPFFFFLATAISGADRAPFTPDGEFKDDYRAIVDATVPGDVFRMPDGRAFRVRGMPDAGSRTFVFPVEQIEPPQDYDCPIRLRIPLNRTENGGIDYVKFLNFTIDGYEALREGGVPVVRVLHPVKGQYVVVEEVDVDITGSTFFREGRGLAPRIEKRAREALLRFAEQTAGFYRIGDFNPSQLGYSIAKDKWYLLDWGTSHELRQLRHVASMSRNVFQGFAEKLSYQRDITEREVAILKDLQQVIYGRQRALHKAEVCAEVTRRLAENKAAYLQLKE